MVSYDLELCSLHGDKKDFGEPSSGPCELGAAISKHPFQRLPTLAQNEATVESLLASLELFRNQATDT